MPTQYAEIFAALAAPFGADEVKERDGGRGRKLSYITARTAANRLDDVLGPENWESEFLEVCECLACRITIRLPDGTKVSKSDGGGFKEMTMKEHGQDVVDQENTDKTAFSDAFKRAAAMFGVGRYLYRDGVPHFAAEAHSGHHAPRPSQTPHANGHAPASSSNSRYGPPTTGRALYAWAKGAEDEHGIGLVKWLDNEAIQAGLPRGRWSDWPDDVQREWVPKLYDMAVAKVAEVIASRSADKQANGQAADFTLANQRKKLKSLILHRACQVTRKATAADLTEAERFAALAECDNVRAGSGGSILSGRIDDCTDAGLLAAYIEIAEGVVEVGSM